MKHITPLKINNCNSTKYAGDFITVYSNLKEVYVKVEDKVTTKQNIGSILYDDDDAKTLLHFEIWKGQTKLNPEDWLFRNN